MVIPWVKFPDRCATHALRQLFLISLLLLLLPLFSLLLLPLNNLFHLLLLPLNNLLLLLLLIIVMLQFLRLTTTAPTRTASTIA
jgi:hypothetical protein